MIHGPTLSDVKSAMHVLTNVYSATQLHFVQVFNLNPNSTVRSFGPNARNGLRSSTIMQMKMTETTDVHPKIKHESTRLSSNKWSNTMICYTETFIPTHNWSTVQGHVRGPQFISHISLAIKRRNFGIFSNKISVLIWGIFPDSIYAITIQT